MGFSHRDWMERQRLFDRQNAPPRLVLDSLPLEARPRRGGALEIAGWGKLPPGRGDGGSGMNGATDAPSLGDDQVMAPYQLRLW
jgi:hypothetical protein